MSWKSVPSDFMYSFSSVDTLLLRNCSFGNTLLSSGFVASLHAWSSWNFVRKGMGAALM